MFVFPIVFFSLFRNMDGNFFLCAIPIAYDNRRFFSVIETLVCLIFVGANCVPKIWDAIQITGTTTTVFVGFVYSTAFVVRWVPSSLFNYLSVIILTYLNLFLHVFHWSQRYTWNCNQEGQCSFIGHDIVSCFLKYCGNLQWHLQPFQQCSWRLEERNIVGFFVHIRFIVNCTFG